MEVKKLTNENHDEIIQSNKLVLLKFGAEWCPPCKMIAPELVSLAAENNDVVVAECDIDDETIESLKAKYNVQTIPHVALLKDGVVVETFAGYKPKAAMLELIDKYR